MRSKGSQERLRDQQSGRFKCRPRSVVVNDDGTATVPLTRGKFAVIDAEYAECVSGLNWFAVKRSNSWYAATFALANGKKRFVQLHRLIAGPSAIEDVDHRDGDGLNNRRSNLRVCTRAQNSANRVSPRGRRSRFKGVCWDKARCKWMAYIKVNYRMKNLGRFDAEEDAAHAYDSAAVKAFGDFAKTNFAEVTDTKLA